LKKKIAANKMQFVGNQQLTTVLGTQCLQVPSSYPNPQDAAASRGHDSSAELMMMSHWKSTTVLLLDPL
jgi:hypothetical protein